ncbi:tetratricopeptide repeat protein [Sporosarcina sp. HYO08]|uniref:tetratricopeptide repeat protein n=1 Tax=Sporosarcina sp. HYO08 TaxID=1759557 RepID=UPI00079C45B2|nr:tetratricopeptide repeat protein [Sporosarcina sp. HYO08]KXH82015.1 hypothetical protein AU377_07115 [Sporosarcina sp. HYO08]
MGKLQEIERQIIEGDVTSLQRTLEALLASTDFDLLYDTAGLLIDYGFLEEADRIYEVLLLHLPNEAQLKIDRAGILLELGQEDEALLLLTDISIEDEEYVQSLLALADYYQMTGMAEAALAKIQEAHKLAPHEPVVRFAYAELLLNAGKYGEAIQYYLELLEEVGQIGPIDLLSRVAEAYNAGAAYEEAIPYYERLLEKSPTPDIIFGAAFAYFQSGRPERTVPLLTDLLEMDPDYFSAYMLAGEALSSTGDDKGAYELFKRGIRRDEFDKALQLAAGKSALKIGLPEQAEVHLKEALVLDPEYVEALITLASLYNEEEKDEELLDLLSYQQATNEGIPLLNAFRAYSYERLEQYNDAYKAYRKAYAELQEEQEFLGKYANFLLEEGRREEAIVIVKKLVELNPDDANWRDFLETSIDEEV